MHATCWFSYSETLFEIIFPLFVMAKDVLENAAKFTVLNRISEQDSAGDENKLMS